VPRYGCVVSRAFVPGSLGRLRIVQDQVGRQEFLDRS